MLGSGLAVWCALQLLIQEGHNTAAVWALYEQALIFAALWSGGEGSTAGAALGSTDVRPFAAYWLGCAGFFHLGNTNSFATLSLSTAYAGFGPTARAGPALVVLCNTYAAPVALCLAGVLGARWLARRVHDRGAAASGVDSVGDRPFPRVCLVPVAACSTNLAAATAALLLHREHLFVWSVFAPKFAYACMATVAAYLAAALSISTL
jgi:ethanolaminephosphotransferase